MQDCRCLVVRGVRHGDGCYQLYFAEEEKLDPKTGAVKSSKTLAPPPPIRVAAVQAPNATLVANGAGGGGGGKR